MLLDLDNEADRVLLVLAAAVAPGDTLILLVDPELPELVIRLDGRGRVYANPATVAVLLDESVSVDDCWGPNPGSN